MRGKHRQNDRQRATVRREKTYRSLAESSSLPRCICVSANSNLASKYSQPSANSQDLLTSPVRFDNRCRRTQRTSSTSFHRNETRKDNRLTWNRTRHSSLKAPAPTCCTCRASQGAEVTVRRATGCRPGQRRIKRESSVAKNVYAREFLRMLRTSISDGQAVPPTSAVLCS